MNNLIANANQFICNHAATILLRVDDPNEATYTNAQDLPGVSGLTSFGWSLLTVAGIFAIMFGAGKLLASAFSRDGSERPQAIVIIVCGIIACAAKGILTGLGIIS